MAITNDITLYDVFLSSPHDVNAERDIVEEVIAHHNRLAFAEKHNYRLQLLRYEQYTAPSAGSPLDIVDTQMGRSDECAIFVCILWSTLGTECYEKSSGRVYPSGTVAEFERAYSAWAKRGEPRIMLYHCTRPLENKNQEKHLQVLSFIEQNKKDLLYKQYQSLEDFRQKFREDLDRIAREYILPLLLEKEASSPRKNMLDSVERSWIEDLNIRREKKNSVKINLVQADDERREKKAIIEGSSLFNIFTQNYRQLIILGGPGAGKTVAMLELMASCINAARRNENLPIPILFSAASWMERKLPIDSWLVDEIQKVYKRERKEASEFVNFLNNDQLIICIDALDEIRPRAADDESSEIKENTDIVAQAWQEEFVKRLNQFLHERSTTHLVLTCRTSEYERLKEKVKVKTSPVRIEPLSDNAVKDYLDRDPDLSSLREALRHNPFLQSMATVPFLLNTMTIAYRDGSRGASVINYPQSLDEHREQLFDLYIHEQLMKALSPLFDKQATQRYLGWLARQIEGKRSLVLVEHIQPDWLTSNITIFDRDYRNYTFFFGMFLALFIGTTVALSCGGAIGYEWAASKNGSPWIGLQKGGMVSLSAGVSVTTLIFAGFFLLRKWQVAFLIALALSVGRGVTIALSKTDDGLREVGIEGGIKAGVATLLVSMPILAYIMWRQDYSRDFIKPLEVVKDEWKWATVKWGIMAGVSTLIPFAYFFGPERGLAFGLLVGAIVTMVAVRSGTPLPAAMRPNEGIRQSACNALRMGTETAVLGILCFGFLYGFQYGSVAGIVNGLLGLTFFIVASFFGAIPVFQHYALRLALWRQNVIPRRWIRFLDYAAKYYLLRKIGGGYIFWHEELRVYFKKFAPNVLR